MQVGLLVTRQNLREHTKLEAECASVRLAISHINVGGT